MISAKRYTVYLESGTLSRLILKASGLKAPGLKILTEYGKEMFILPFLIFSCIFIRMRHKV